MKIKIWIFLFSVSFSSIAFAQCIQITDSSITYFNSVIDSLDYIYKTTEPKTLQSLPQSFGHYFWFESKQADSFIQALETGIPIDSLVTRYPDLAITRNLLLVRHTIPFLINGKKRTSIHGLPEKHFDTYELDLDTARIHKHDNTEIYWQKYNTYDGKIIIRGFWVLKEFRTWQIPVSFSDWAHYYDVLTIADEKLFLSQNKNPLSINTLNASILDSMVLYFETVSNFPVNKDYKLKVERSDEFKTWKTNFNNVSDSLFRIDPVFRSLLKQSFEFSLKNHLDNDYLIAWVERFYSEEDLVKIIRNNERLGSHDFNTSVVQNQKISKYAFENHNWALFVKSMLQIGAINVYKSCHIDTEEKTFCNYFEELMKFNIDMLKIALSLSLRSDDNLEDFFEQDYYHITDFIGNLDNQSQSEFEASILHLIVNEHIDPLNRCYFYLTYCYLLSRNNPEHRSRLLAISKADYLFKYFLDRLRFQLEYPHQALYDLLKNEKKELDKFQIVSHSIYPNPDATYSKGSWNATLYDKEEKYRIYYDLQMSIDSVVPSFSLFSNQQANIKKRIGANPFLLSLLDLDTEASLNIKFDVPLGFGPSLLIDFPGMPDDLHESIDFQNAVMIEFSSYKYGFVNVVLLRDNTLFLTRLSHKFCLPNYTFDELHTMNVRNEWGMDVPYSYKIFNSKGDMQN